MKKLLLIITCSLSFNLFTEDSKVLIITMNHNSPDFIILQDKTFKKFLKEKYSYVVFNDAPDDKIAERISETCNARNILCLRVPQDNRTEGPPHPFSWASTRHAQAIQYAMEEVGFLYDGIVILIDSDMFLIKNFSATDYLQNYDITGLLQQIDNKTYLWPGLMMFQMNKLPQKETMTFSPCTINKSNLDTGGSLYFYLAKHPKIKMHFFEQEGRLFLEKDLSIRIRPCKTKKSPYQNFIQVKCNKCFSQNLNCNHTIDILKQRHFSNTIIEKILDNSFPLETEFVLQDTFLHFRGISNYLNKPADFINEKNKKLYRFINELCDDL